MKALRIGLCGLLAFAVLAHGAVEVWSEAIVEIGAALLLCLWVALSVRGPKLDIRWNPLNGPLLGFFAIGVLQLLLHTSAYPFLTRIELLRVATCCIVFFLANQAFRTKRDLQGLAWFLIFFCFAVSLEAIAQYFTADNSIYWVRQISTGVKPIGPYVNRNHFAGFVELTLPTGLALPLFGALRRGQAPLTILLTLIPLSAVVLSASRAGIICVAIEIALLMGLSRMRKRAGGARFVVLVAAATAAIVLIGWVGAGAAMARFGPGGAVELSFARRASMVRGAAHVFLANPILGSGLGTIIATYPRYETMYDGKVVDHVHNDYAEVLAETGIFGGACGLAFLWLLVRAIRRNLQTEQGRFSRALHVAAFAAVTGMLLHSLVDFNLHIFSNALLFLLQVFLVTSPPLASEGPSWQGPRRKFVG